MAEEAPKGGTALTPTLLNAGTFPEVGMEVPRFIRSELALSAGLGSFLSGPVERLSSAGLPDVSRGRTIGGRSLPEMVDPPALATGGASGIAPPSQGIALSPLGGASTEVDVTFNTSNGAAPLVLALEAARTPEFAGPPCHAFGLALASIRKGLCSNF